MASTIEEDRLKLGYRLSHPAPGDEVFITGISGSFPDTDSVAHLQQNLFNKVDLVSGDSRRWNLSHPEIPQRTGKLNNVNKFDASFFGVHYKEAHTMDPMCRILLEKTYEAIYDAGLNPSELRNTKTGVFMSTCFSETEKTWLYEKMENNKYGISGCSKAMLANRVSYWLGVTGPSYTIDSGCSGSLHALEHAFKAIREGHLDTAIVGGSNLCLLPYVSLQFFRLGSLSSDGRCKTFDNSANGYVRSEAIAVCILQKAKDSRRVHAQVVYVKSNCDGFKEEGITHPSCEAQKLLFKEFYEECDVSPTDVEFIDAHGTGTKAGDPVELNSLGAIFCNGRSGPLLLGSIKTNLGHGEPTAGLCSIAKLCIAYNTGYIAPNLNYKVPREGVSFLADGKIKVVTEKHPWSKGLFAVNSFGIGGANSHILLKNSGRPKINNGMPSDDLPRLVCVSGRTESAVAKILDELESKTVDVELVGLLHAIHEKDIAGHVVRGYTLLESLPHTSVSLVRDIQHFSGVHRPVVFAYSGVDSQWAGMATQLMRIPVFAAAIERCHKTLKPEGINLTKLLIDPDFEIYNNILKSFIGIAAIQIGVTDILKAVRVQPDYVVGHGMGELGCAYADGTLTAEQMILSAYREALISMETPFIKNSVADVALGYNDVKKLVPPEIEVCCNGSECSRISGPLDQVESFVAKLAAQGIVAKVTSCSNVANYSRYVAEAGPKLLKYLKQVIPSPKPRSERWLTPSTQQTIFSKNSTAKLSSPEYHTNNFLKPVFFEEAARLLPTNAIIIEIVPHDILQRVLPAKKDFINIPLTGTKHQNNVHTVLTALGKLYEYGLNPHLASIYPAIKFPVSRGTPMLSHLVEWEHSDDWFVTSYKSQQKMESSERTMKMSITNENYDYIVGHIVEGRNLYPATGYIVMVWETLGMMMGELFTEVSVVFENVRFHRATNIPKNGTVEFVVTIQRGSGNFEVVESGAPIVTGQVYAKKNVGQEYRALPAEPESKGYNAQHLLTKDFYKELRLRGYQYSGLFQGIIGCNVEGTRGRLAWVDNWVTFLDCMLQMKIIADDTRRLFVPTCIEKLCIDADIHYNAISKMKKDFMNRSFDIRVYPNVDVIRSGGVEIRGVDTSPITRRLPSVVPVLEKHVFIPNFGTSVMEMEDILRSNVQLIIENMHTFKVKIIEIIDDKNTGSGTILKKLANVLSDMHLVQADLSVISEKKLKLITGNNLIFIGANLLQRPDVLKSAMKAGYNKGFIMSREEKAINPKDFSEKYDIVTIQDTGFERMILLRKRVEANPAKYIKIISSDDTFAWIEKVKGVLKVEQKVVLYCQDDDANGLLGLINCLKKEYGNDVIRGLLIADPSAPTFDPELVFYKGQLDMDLTMNVYQDSQWGTYRHLLLGSMDTVQAQHAFVSTDTIGDLSSLRWLEGPIPINPIFKNSNNYLIHVHCAALNYRDMITASGRVSLDAIARGRLVQDCVHGYEIVGKTCNGSRVMSIVKDHGLANVVVGDKTFTWGIPNEWTFEEAATVPVAYATVYYALVMIGQIQRGESILIHAGSGAVGQAAINVALSFGCEIFTTVGTAEKREFIKKLYPQIKDSHIGNSRDTSFEGMIRKQKNGKGVDMVLNTLSDETFQASMRCLGYRGRFLEIGKFDIRHPEPIGMHFFVNEISFHGITLDYVMDKDCDFGKEVGELLLSGIQSGVVRPLTSCKFEKNEIESAFRYMTAGKHTGKVVIKIRDEDPSNITKPQHIPIDAVPRYTCDEDSVYILVGGLGGFGLELANWLIVRGARKVLLTSRRGISNGYQSSRLRVWAGYGADVQISTHDVTTEDGCEQMLKMANFMGTVDAIFNLAVILENSMFKNQNAASFMTLFGPKVLATINLDKLSMKLCPQLRQFVVFSSVTCGRGNAGQTNYGYSSSIMERLCEARRARGLPALAIQWGAIGDVGIVADMQHGDEELEICGTLPQSIFSCLVALDKFLKQDAVVVSSMVVAKKKTDGYGCGGVAESVARILGIKDLKKVPPRVSLSELGMDSMMAVEIKQTLQRQFEINLSAQEIRNLTFARMEELAGKKEVKASPPEYAHLTKREDTVDLRS